MRNSAPIMPALVNTTAKTFTIREVSGDKAFGSLNNYDVIESVAQRRLSPSRAFTPRRRWLVAKDVSLLFVQA